MNKYPETNDESIRPCDHPEEYRQAELCGYLSHEGGELVDRMKIKVYCSVCGEYLDDEIEQPDGLVF